MAEDAITFIEGLGLGQVDLFGFSMGGMIAQEIALMRPELVRRMIITGTGPAGGEGISKVGRITYLDMLRGLLTGQDPKQFLFFTRTAAGIRAGKEFLQRLQERTSGRDKKITVRALQAQLKALRLWGEKSPAGPVEDPSAGARRQRGQRPHGPEPEHLRPGAALAEQRAHRLSRLRPRRGLPVPRRLRAQGAAVSFALNRAGQPPTHGLRRATAAPCPR
jgi:pimeloyl-ACP methyl ester carboxylesterase